MKEQHIKEHPLMNEGAGGADMRSTFLLELHFLLVYIKD